MKILIVDDSKLNRTIEGTLIENSKLGVDIFYAESGDQALNILNEEDIEIILLDIIMPGIDGIEVLKIIKEKYSNIKTLMCSSVSEKEKLKECFEIGASDYITKPIEEIEFISRIKNTIRQKELENETLSYIHKIKSQKSIISTAQMKLMQQEKMAGVGHLAAGIAHEINNPLGFIVSNIDILKDYVDTFTQCFNLLKEDNKCDLYNKFYEDNDFEYILGDLVELFSDTEIGLERVKVIINCLRNFSKVDVLEEVSDYDVNQSIKDTLIILTNSIKYIARVETHYDKVPEIEAIGGLINQTLSNILSNAVKGITEKKSDSLGLINIRTYCDKNYVYISIKDDGIGMSKETCESVFNPFFTTREAGDGTGLGLTISYDVIVNKHNGKIDIQSKENEGTDVVISLPIKDGKI